MNNIEQEVKEEETFAIPLFFFSELFPVRECECGTGLNKPTHFSFTHGLIYPECGGLEYETEEQDGKT